MRGCTMGGRPVSGILLLGLLAALLLTSSSAGAEWQWAVPVEQAGSQAYLWIPPSCEHVRGLIVGDMNALEQIALESPIVREAAEKAGLAIVWFVPKSLRWFQYKAGADQILLKALADLATESGYSEIAHAPLIPIGHSASTPFAWYVGYWKPDRTIAVISLKGATFPPPEFDKDAFAPGVPALAITGEYYEYPMPEQSRLARWPKEREIVLRWRARGERDLLSFFVDVSGGHMDFTDGLARIIALYIEKAAQYRLPAESPIDGPVQLKAIAPKSGWLTDPDTVLAEHAAPVPYKEHRGDPAKMFWAFDEEMARAMDQYGADQKTKAFQMVGFVQDGQTLSVADKGYSTIRYEPLEDDEMSFRLAGTYLEQAPLELANQPALTGHADAPIEFACTAGPVVQTAPNAFRIRFNRLCPAGGTVAQLLAHSPGDEKFRKAFQPGIVEIPANHEGAPQTITFEKISDQIVGAKEVPLRAAADSGLPVEFFVKYGPAEVKGNRLVLGAIPPRSRLPVKVCVVAYQWGRMKSPPVQAAKSVEQVFVVHDAAAK
jgi:hypothetical protein